MTYFVTGGTGLIGRELLGRLADRGVDVDVLVRPRSLQRWADWIDGLDARARAAGGSVRAVEGDVTQAGLGLSGYDRAIEHFFHVAGYYDIAGDAARMRSVNVDGTQHVIDFLGAHSPSALLHHASSVAVAGDYAGEFPEDELDCGQGFDHEYHRSKYDAEVLVRASGLRHRIYRPSAVVGHSETGEMDRVDGPYFLFKMVQKLGHALPGWAPMMGWSNEQVNMVPVDFVADVIDAAAHQPDRDGQTFHIADPDPLTLPQVYNTLAPLAGAPRMSGTLGAGKRKGSGMLGNVRQMFSSLGAATFLREQLLSDYNIPAAISAAKNTNVSYATTNLESVMSRAEIRCPKPEKYLPALWFYWAQHLDPDRDEKLRWERTFGGKTVLITGASSGVGEAMARMCAECGARVVLLARREELLQDIVSQIESAGGKADYFVADLSDLDAIGQLVEDVVARHGHIDVLVNNAARSIRRPIAGSYDRLHDYERTMRLNYLAPVALCLGFLPTMVQAGGGHIVSVLTAGSHLPSPYFSAYTASKAALSQFTDTLSAEYLHEGVHTTSAYLSWVVTPMMTATDKYAEKVKRENIMTPERASAWIMDGVAYRKRKLYSATTLRRFMWSTLFPKFMTRSLSYVFQVYHDDRERFANFDIDKATLGRWVKSDPL